ncbi:MAG: aminotransferase class V-fold PLP-dependent enzyme [Candidatus Caldatribacteriota bacterium]|nr:aminotransferase class V-fold PLP-dependent enzyme [Candidatus Caldatribacteriota bacterium]
MDEQKLAVSVCSFEPSSGFRCDLHKLGEVCKERNVNFAIDTTQSLGAMELGVREMNIDVMVASSYKWINLDKTK